MSVHQRMTLHLPVSSCYLRQAAYFAALALIASSTAGYNQRLLHRSGTLKLLLNVPAILSRASKLPSAGSALGMLTVAGEP